MTHALHRDADGADTVRAPDRTRIVLRPLATPLPLGILALGFGSILPITRRSTSQAAISGNLGDQLTSLASEAGVRQQS